MDCPEIPNVRDSYYGTFNMNVNMSNEIDFGCQGFCQKESENESFHFFPQMNSVYAHRTLKLNNFNYL